MAIALVVSFVWEESIRAIRVWKRLSWGFGLVLSWDWWKRGENLPEERDAVLLGSHNPLCRRGPGPFCASP